MKSYQKEGLRKMQEMYDYIAANPNCTMHMLCCWFEICTSTLRTPLHHLRDGGYIDATPGKRSKGGQAPSTYLVTDKGRPTKAPDRKPNERLVADSSVKRVFKPARQLGLAPDAHALPRDFFRPAA